MNFQQAVKPLLYFALVALGVLLGIFLKPGDGNITNTGSDKLGRVITILKNKYVDTINVPQLEESAIGGMLEKLDPHSVYIPARELQEVNEQLQGNFYGIGVEFNILHDTITILNVIQGGPASKAGLLSGDRIVKVNEEGVAGKLLTTSDVRKKLKGPKDTKVKVGVWRPSGRKYFTINLVRDEIPLHSVNASGFLKPGLGYLRITRFAENTYEEFREHLVDLKNQGMKKLVIDLRGNPGGYLNAATQIVDELLNGGKKIVYTKRNVKENGKAGEVIKNEIFSKDGGLFESGDLYILMDEHSASASEILAGAVQDWDRGVVIGRRSFGKGLVQDQMTLGDGSAFRVTVARYYTPSGRCIQKPYNHGQDAYENELRERRNRGKDTSETKEIYKTKGGRIVYGGGGIYPDIMVSIDTGWYSAGVSEIFESSIIQELVLVQNVSIKHLAGKTPLYIFQDQTFKKTKKEIERQLAVKFPNFYSFPESAKEYISRQISAQLGSSLMGEKGYYMMMIYADGVFINGIEQALKFRLPLSQ